MNLQRIALKHLEQQLIKRFEIITDTSKDENYSSMQEFVKYSRDVKKLTDKEMKRSTKVSDKKHSKKTREQIKQIRLIMKSIRFDL